MERRVAIVSPRPVIGHSLASFLTHAGLTPLLVGDWTADDFPARLEASRARVALLDLDPGDDLSCGSETVLSRVATCTPVVVLSGTSGLHGVRAYLAAGAVEVVAKTAYPGDLLCALDRAAASENLRALVPAHRERTHNGAVSQREAARTARVRVARLTPTETAVLMALADGQRVTDIAAQRCVSVMTVRSHVRSILLKLEVTSQLAAVAVLRRATA